MRKTLLFSASAAILYLTITSYSTGPANGGLGNRTGSPGSNGTCAAGGCHTTGAATASIEVRDKNLGPTSTPVTNYVAGNTYLVTIKGTGPNNRFGFQVTALDGTATPIGVFGDFSAGNIQGFPTTSPTIVEQSSAFQGSSNAFDKTFEWTAPSTGSGAITLYGIVNSVNFNGQSTGDVVSPNTSVTLADNTSVNDLANTISISAYPNPATDIVRLDMTNVSTGDYAINVFDISGRRLLQNQIAINNNTYSFTLNTQTWVAGVYYVQVLSENGSQVIPIVKQ